MKNTNIINKYVIAIQVFLLAVVFVVASTVTVSAQEYTYNEPVYGGSDYTYNEPVYGGSDYSYNEPVYGGSDYTYNEPVYGGSDYGSYPVSSGGYTISGGYDYYYPSYSYGYYGGGSTVRSGGFSGGTTYIVPAPVYYISTSTVWSGGFTGGGNGGYTNDPSLSGTCSVSGNAQVGQVLTWSTSASGGSGFYTFVWSGDENLSGSGQSISRVYNYSGTKNATVTITSNGQSITRNCAVNVGTTNQVLAYNDTNPLSAVYLSDLPYTGAGDTAKIVLFITTLILWSASAALYFLKKKQRELSEVLVSATEAPQVINADAELLSDIEAYARSQKVLLSSDAIMKLAKMQKLNNVNPNQVISRLSSGEWKAVGEMQIQ